MARANHTPIAPSKIKAIASQLGLSIKEKKGEFKVYHSTTGIKKSIGVPNTKLVTRVELVGFEMKGEGYVAHPKPPAATVTQMVDFTLPEKLVLRAIFKACKALVAKPVASPAPTKEEVMNDSPAASPAPTQEAEQPASATA